MENEDEELVFGAKGIAALIGGNERQVYHLIQKGEVPGVFMMGGRIAGLPSVIRAGLRERARKGIVAATKETA